MKKSNAFTLSELLVALAVLGIVCAIVLPTLLNNNPNHNKMMMKKAYNVFTDITQELINDSGHYPVIFGLCPDDGNDGYIGFDCASSDAKFPYLFYKNLSSSAMPLANENAMKTNTAYSRSGLTDCNGAASSCYFIESEDGITCAFAKKKLTKGSYTDTLMIGIDINGDKKPNCYEGSTAENCKKRTANFDQFRIKLSADGTIKINEDDTWAIEAIQASSSLTK